MKHEALLRHLAQARQHVAEGRFHIAAQRKLIEELDAEGSDATQARRALVILERMQVTHVTDYEMIRKALEDGAPIFSRVDDFRRVQSARGVARGSVEELRWYQAKIAETVQVLQRSKETLVASREILLQLEELVPTGASKPPGTTLT